MNNTIEYKIKEGYKAVLKNPEYSVGETYLPINTINNILKQKIIYSNNTWIQQHEKDFHERGPFCIMDSIENMINFFDKIFYKCCNTELICIMARLDIFSVEYIESNDTYLWYIHKKIKYKGPTINKCSKGTIFVKTFKLKNNITQKIEKNLYGEYI